MCKWHGGLPLKSDGQPYNSLPLPWCDCRVEFPYKSPFLSPFCVEKRDPEEEGEGRSLPRPTARLEVPIEMMRSSGVVTELGLSQTGCFSCGLLLRKRGIFVCTYLFAPLRQTQLDAADVGLSAEVCLTSTGDQPPACSAGWSPFSTHSMLQKCTVPQRYGICSPQGSPTGSCVGYRYHLGGTVNVWTAKVSCKRIWAFDNSHLSGRRLRHGAKLNAHAEAAVDCCRRRRPHHCRHCRHCHRRCSRASVLMGGCRGLVRGYAAGRSCLRASRYTASAGRWQHTPLSLKLVVPAPAALGLCGPQPLHDKNQARRLHRPQYPCLLIAAMLTCHRPCHPRHTNSFPLRGQAGGVCMLGWCRCLVGRGGLQSLTGRSAAATFLMSLCGSVSPAAASLQVSPPLRHLACFDFT